MKTLIAALLATAAGASFAAPTFALNHDPASYRNATQKASTDYNAAVQKCDGMKDNNKDICMAEAKLARNKAEATALAKYSTSPAARQKARASLADAEYALAKERCDDKSGADKDECMSNAKSVHTAALADAKADRGSNAGASTSASGTSATGTSSTSTSGASSTGATAAGGLVAGTDTRDPAKAAAVDKCAQAGDSKTGCLIETKPSPVRENAAAAADTAAAKTRDAAATAADKTKAAAATAADKTKEVAQVAVEKTKAVASTVAQKTGNAMDRAGENTREATATAAQKTDKAMDQAGDKTKDATASTRVAAADTAITTKVKAGLVKEPDLSSLGIHVETEKGVVMLSGFVNSKAEADKAVKVAKGVDGVSKVKSAIQVK